MDLNPRLARQVAEALTDLDPAAAHADAELRLEALVRCMADRAAGD
jgi:hypothetical protein